MTLNSPPLGAKVALSLECCGRNLSKWCSLTPPLECKVYSTVLLLTKMVVSIDMEWFHLLVGVIMALEHSIPSTDFISSRCEG
jgi:hypothetical protein